MSAQSAGSSPCCRILFIFVVIGNVNYSEPQPNWYPTISEIIDDSSSNASVYLIFAVTYGAIKFLLIILTLLDSDIVYSELVEKRMGFFSNNAKQLFFTLSAVAAIFASFQLLALILLVFVPISTQYTTHVFVAAIIFVSACLKSVVLLVRRLMIYNIKSVFFAVNALYIVALLGSAIGFYFDRAGLLEYFLVFLILLENALLTSEFYYLYIEFTARLDALAVAQYRSIDRAVEISSKFRAQFF